MLIRVTFTDLAESIRPMAALGTKAARSIVDADCRHFFDDVRD
jgi:hypothetical protein